MKDIATDLWATARPWVLGIVLGWVLAYCLSSCHPDKPTGPELTRSQQKRVEAARDTALARASRDSARAQQAITAATAHYRQAQSYQDSATYYANHEDIIRLSAADTTRLQRIFSEITGPPHR